jgi:hypothetical protein
VFSLCVSTQGAGIVRVVLGAFATACSPLQPLLALTQSLPLGAAPHPPLHHAVVLGAACGCLGLSPAAACRVYVFTLLRDLISAATRLNVVGPQQAAALLAELAPLGEKALQRRLVSLEALTAAPARAPAPGQFDVAWHGAAEHTAATALALAAACTTAPLQVLPVVLRSTPALCVTHLACSLFAQPLYHSW